MKLILCLALPGGRTQWGCHVRVGHDRFSSNPYYDFSDIYTAREKAAEIAFESYSKVIEHRLNRITRIWNEKERATRIPARAPEHLRGNFAKRANTQDEAAESHGQTIQHYHTNLLREYLESGDHDGLDRAIRAGANVNAILYPSTKGSPLLIAIDRRDKKAVNILLQAGADIYASVILRALDANDGEIVQLLPKAGADVNYGYTLLVAINYGCRDIVELLLYVGASPNYGYALLVAISYGSKDIVELLLNAGADANYGYPLVVAIRRGRKDIVELLLHAGADVNRGHTIKAAVEYGDIEILHILLEAGANPNFGDSLLDEMGRGRNDIAKLIVHAGLDVYHNSALAISAQNGDTEVVRMLLAAGADANMPCTDRPYGSPLVAAIMSGRENMVKSIIAGGADVNMQCTNGKYPSPLVAAIRESDTTEKWPGLSRAARSRIIELLLEYGADVNLQLDDDRCRSALDAALDINDDQIIRAILIAGAHIGSTSNGVTITCPWELPHILFSDTEELHVFNLATLTKTDEGILLATCAEYLEKSYGKQGINVLEGIICALKDPDRVHGQY